MSRSLQASRLQSLPQQSPVGSPAHEPRLAGPPPSPPARPWPGTFCTSCAKEDTRPREHASDKEEGIREWRRAREEVPPHTEQAAFTLTMQEDILHQNRRVWENSCWDERRRA